METYHIQKYIGRDEPDAFNFSNRHDWPLAWGMKLRSWPKARSDEEAIAIFRNEVAKSKKCAYRILRYGGGGYGTHGLVIATHNCNTNNKKACA